VKKASVSCVWITPIIGPHQGSIVGAGQDRFGQGNGENGIIGEAAIRTEQIELLGLDVLPLVTDPIMSPAIAPIIWMFLEGGLASFNALEYLGIILEEISYRHLPEGTQRGK
jgi:hypothetical protein